jgi:ribose/xylose/arabinose/galactoside ABC-type transport system permease subunit
MQDQTGYAAIALGMAIWLAVVSYFVVRAEPSKLRTWLLWLAGIVALLIASVVIGILAAWGVLGDVAIFVATLAGCAVLLGGVVYYMKHRPQQFEDLTQAQPAQQNFVTPGQYASDTPTMRRRIH